MQMGSSVFNTAKTRHEQVGGEVHSVYINFTMYTCLFIHRYCMVLSYMIYKYRFTIHIFDDAIRCFLCGFVYNLRRLNSYGQTTSLCLKPVRGHHPVRPTPVKTVTALYIKYG